MDSIVARGQCRMQAMRVETLTCVNTLVVRRIRPSTLNGCCRHGKYIPECTSTLSEPRLWLAHCHCLFFFFFSLWLLLLFLLSVTTWKYRLGSPCIAYHRPPNTIPITFASASPSSKGLLDRAIISISSRSSGFVNVRSGGRGNSVYWSPCSQAVS